MSLLSNLTKEGRAYEENLYEQVSDEMDRDYILKGLWAKATADSDGNESQIKSRYIKYRVQSLKDELDQIKQGERREKLRAEDESLKEEAYRLKIERQKIAEVIRQDRNKTLKKVITVTWIILAVLILFSMIFSYL